MHNIFLFTAQAALSHKIPLKYVDINSLIFTSGLSYNTGNMSQR